MPGRRHRQGRLEARRGRGRPHDRIMVVCEGSKTEPRYFTQIRIERKLGNKLVLISGCPSGTAPLQIIEAAAGLFRDGNRHNDINPGSFDRIYAVFDRDQHPSYREALEKAEQLDLAMKNDEGRKVPFTAIPSNPCFELWLLIHFLDVTAHSPCGDVEARLREHLPNYRKGSPDSYASTVDRLEDARIRARRLAESSSPHSDDAPYTDVHLLVDTLRGLKG